MSSRTGKIARLPNEIREELNRRLRDGLDSAAILPWVNSLTTTQSAEPKPNASPKSDKPEPKSRQIKPNEVADPPAPVPTTQNEARWT